MNRRLSFEEFDRVLCYDPNTGIFRWKVETRNTKIGSVAGSIGRSGQRCIRVNRVLYTASHLAWLAVYREWPARQIERIDGDPGNDKIANLRLAKPPSPKRYAKGRGAPRLTAEYVRERLQYDPETGAFRWRHPAGKHGHIPAGSEAGTIDGRGYRRISLFDYPYSAAHIAVLYMTGFWPDYEIDHINNDPSDNRWRNLRQTDREGNTQNRRLPKNNTTGHKGVFVDKDRPGVYRAVVDAFGKRHYLGCFRSLEEAVKARRAKVEELHGTFANHG